jgi:hypothetical protein
VIVGRTGGGEQLSRDDLACQMIREIEEIFVRGFALGLGSHGRTPGGLKVGM